MLFYEEVKESRGGLAPPLLRGGEGHPISPLSPLPCPESGDKLTQLQVCLCAVYVCLYRAVDLSPGLLTFYPYI